MKQTTNAGLSDIKTNLQVTTSFIGKEDTTSRGAANNTTSFCLNLFALFIATHLR